MSNSPRAKPSVINNDGGSYVALDSLKDVIREVVKTSVKAEVDAAIKNAVETQIKPMVEGLIVVAKAEIIEECKTMIDQHVLGIEQKPKIDFTEFDQPSPEGESPPSVDGLSQ